MSPLETLLGLGVLLFFDMKLLELYAAWHLPRRPFDRSAASLASHRQKYTGWRYAARQRHGVLHSPAKVPTFY
eukprot:6202223-Pleurochrysis_carterae.AAC.3